MAPRLPKTELTGISGTMMKWLARKRLGVVPEPLEVCWHNRKVLKANMGYGHKASKWDAVDQNLKSFAHMAVAAQVGCSWCLDLGYFQAQDEGLDMGKASQVPCWRDSDAFTPLERDVLEYAEAMSNTPTTVSDELAARLLDRLGPAAMLELTAFVGFSNFAARQNTALGIESQGFSSECEIPLADAGSEVPA